MAGLTQFMVPCWPDHPPVAYGGSSLSIRAGPEHFDRFALLLLLSQVSGGVTQRPVCNGGPFSTSD